MSEDPPTHIQFGTKLVCTKHGESTVYSEVAHEHPGCEKCNEEEAKMIEEIRYCEFLKFMKRYEEGNIIDMNAGAIKFSGKVDLDSPGMTGLEV